jgi:metal-responsive CopG/Arc/MetJ family transcriptional regulator
MAKEIRLQFNFSQDAVKRLDDLVKSEQCVSRAELLRRALRFYEYTAKKLHDDYKIQFVKEGEITTTVVLI